MAVNYANSLVDKISLSSLIVSRSEGLLKGELRSDVVYLFAQKKYKFDLSALKKIHNFCLANNITHIHAHSSSIYTAILIKFCMPNLKIIWHDHYGNSEFLEKRPSFLLAIFSFFIDGVICVNKKLEAWGNNKLNCRKIIFLNNFSNFSDLYSDNKNNRSKLKGVIGKKIICLANLREQKDHFFLIDIAFRLKNYYKDWTFHLVGKDFNDAYSYGLKRSISDLELNENVYIYGSRNDVSDLLKESDIGILTSKSEGLPVSLLEYAFQSLPVIVTKVGEIPNWFEEDFGFMIENGNVDDFVEKLIFFIENKDFRVSKGKKLNEFIVNNFSSSSVLNKYLDFIS